MSSQNHKQSLYPRIIESDPPFLSPNPSSSRPSLYPSLQDPNPNPNPNPQSSSSSSLYPSIEMKELVENLFPEVTQENGDGNDPKAPPAIEETLIRVPGAILHLIDRQNSVELAAGDFSVARILQAENTVAVLARIGDVQWPLARDEAAVKLDDSHYFFSLHDPTEDKEPGGENTLNYGLTFASKGQETLLKELDSIFESYSSFSVEKVKVKGKGEVLDGSVEREMTPVEAAAGPKKEILEGRSAAYWTTLAPNVEDYSSSMAKAIAKGSGKLIKGILWCGDVTVDRLKWVEDSLKRRTGPNSKPSEVSKDALKRMKRFGLFPPNL